MEMTDVSPNYDTRQEITRKGWSCTEKPLKQTVLNERQMGGDIPKRQCKWLMLSGDGCHYL